MSQVLSILSTTTDAFADYIRKLPKSSLDFSPSIIYGPREVLIHLTYWQEHYNRIIKDILQGKKPQLSSLSFKELNALAIEKNKKESVDQLIKRLKIAQTKIEKLSRRIGFWQLKIAFKNGGKLRPLEEAFTKIEAHIRSHQRQLVRRGFK